MADPEAKQRFLQEARVASSIRHENIVGVYDFGEDQGRPFIVMEFVEGESLRDAIRLHHLGDLRSRLKIALAIARAVDHIHTRKIIHRDLKPDNIHVDSQGKALLMDFGIAKTEGVQLTRVGFTLGTPYYMPPEQVLGKPLTPQADVYAFGILLYELLTGVRPVKDGSVDQIFQAILSAASEHGAAAGAETAASPGKADRALRRQACGASTSRMTGSLHGPAKDPASDAARGRADDFRPGSPKAGRGCSRSRSRSSLFRRPAEVRPDAS